MDRIDQKIANVIFEREAFELGSFPLNLHEINPGVSSSPFYINLRTKDNPDTKGLLTSADCKLISQALWCKALDTCFNFNAIAGLPYTAAPFIEAIDEMTRGSKGFRIIPLAKKVVGGKHCIVPVSGFEYYSGEEVLLFNDSITDGKWELEAAKVIESQGTIVAGFVVWLNRGQGGVEQVEAAGYDVHYCITIRQLLEHYKQEGVLSSLKYLACTDYVENN